MPRDGNGDFSRTVTPPVNGDVADATKFNDEMNDVASALSDSINKNGTKALAADLPCGGFKLTGLGAGSSNGDSVRFEQLAASIAAAVGVTVQGLDATLTALAALSWSSGNALVQFTAADTVSLTLTPSVSSITTSQGAAATTPSASFTNTTDNASVRVASFSGDRATPANSDTAYVSYYMSDNAGNQDEMMRWSWQPFTNTSGAETAAIYLGIIAGGTLADRFVWTSTAYRPNSNDAASLGTGSASWSDLFLASGGVINWSNGTFTLTQSGANLAPSGGFSVAISSETSDALTSASRNRQVHCSGDITLPSSGMSDGDIILIDPRGTARTITRPGSHTMYIAGTDSATGTTSAHNIVTAKYHGSSKWTLQGAVV